MGLVSHRVERSNLEAGDHIYTYRAAFTYSHHGIYLGENKVVHFTCDKDSNSSAISSSSISSVLGPCPDPECGFRVANSGVLRSCLDCFMNNGSLCRFEYGVGLLTFAAKIRGGTCTTAKSDPPEIVVSRATYLLENGYGNYDLLTRNCEDFCLYCKTGRLVYGGTDDPVGGSGQSVGAIGVSLAALVALPLKLVGLGQVVVLTTSATLYTIGRYANDIGVNDAAVEVNVETLA